MNTGDIGNGTNPQSWGFFKQFEDEGKQFNCFVYFDNDVMRDTEGNPACSITVLSEVTKEITSIRLSPSKTIELSRFIRNCGLEALDVSNICITTQKQ